MFQEVEAIIQKVEAKLTGTLGAGKAKIGKVEQKITEIEQGVLSPFDAIQASVAKSKNDLKAQVTSLRNDVKKFAPPK